MSKLTLDEAIKHCLEVAEQNEKKAEYRPRMDYYDEIESRADCLECAADHRQLAEWLMEYKDLKNSIGAVKLSNMKEALELIRAYKAENIAQKKLIAEYKRLLKLAVEDMSEKNFCVKACKRDNFACRVSDTCDFKWRYADEAEKLLNDEK